MLVQGASNLRKSDESALSIIPSRLSSKLPSLFSNGSHFSFESVELVYNPLSIDNDLFNANVYKRNYRNGLMYFKPGIRRPALQRQNLRQSVGSIHTIDSDDLDPDVHDI